MTIFDLLVSDLPLLTL